jgi:hypothetical protein
MQQYPHKGFREAKARQENLIRSAPTEPDAFLLWGARLERQDGKFELSRGRVTCHTMAAVFRGIPDAPTIE